MRISDWSSDVCSSDLSTSGLRILHSRLKHRAPESSSSATALARPALRVLVTTSPPPTRQELSINRVSVVSSGWVTSVRGPASPTHSSPLLAAPFPRLGVPSPALSTSVSSSTRAIGRASFGDIVCHYVYISLFALSLKN